MSNAYFQIGCTDSGTILKLIKQKDGGLPLDAKEISDYLNKNKVMFQAGDITKGINALAVSEKNEQLVLLNRDRIPEIRESYILKSTPDKMTLTARFYPSSLKGEKMMEDEFINDLAYKGVKFGIDTERITKFCNNPEYCTDVVVANGQPAKEGTHAYIEYYFETDLSAKPALNEDGSVDFFHLKTYTKCNAGDVLAKLFPEVPGEPGTNVFGEPIRPLAVKRKVLKYGENIEVTDDGRMLKSKVSGHVKLVEERVFVSNVMEVDNVNTATGDIDYDGSVVVLGNVFENFTVKAKGNVEVKGVVEGAHIESDGDIIIARGMNGMGKGFLKAGGNIIAKFLENSEVSANGYIETESILHCDVSAGTEVQVTGKKGFITGGKVCAANLIRVKTLGSDMGADTIVEVGADPSVKRRIQELQKNIQSATKSLEQGRPILASFAKKLQGGQTLSLDQKMYMQTLMTEEQEKSALLTQWKEEFASLSDVLEQSTVSTVEVTGDVYAGTRINISDVSMTVKNTMTYCRFRKIDGDVKMQSL